MTPDFSIILPAYNNLGLFTKCLHSILMQEGVTFNVFVVDDSVNNDIENYISSIKDERIIYTHNTPPLGAVRNWNSGLKKIDGNIGIVIHHDESLAYNHALRDIKKEIAEHHVVISKVRVSNGGREYTLMPDWIRRWARCLPSALFAVNSIGPCACIAFKTEHMAFFDERLEWFVDTEWYYQIIAHHSTYVSDTIRVCSSHGHKGQITNNININSTAKRDYKLLRKKYRKNISVTAALFINIYIIHNNIINEFIHAITRRN